MLAMRCGTKPGAPTRNSLFDARCVELSMQRTELAIEALTWAGPLINWGTFRFRQPSKVSQPGFSDFGKRLEGS